MIGLDAKVVRQRDKKYVSHIIFATSNEIFVVNVGAIVSRMPNFMPYRDWSALGSLLSDSKITKVSICHDVVVYDGTR